MLNIFNKKQTRKKEEEDILNSELCHYHYYKNYDQHLYTAINLSKHAMLLCLVWQSFTATKRKKKIQKSVS